MVCLFVSTQEPSFCKVNQTAKTMELPSSSSSPSKAFVRVPPSCERKCECECGTDQEDGIEGKRRFQTLLQREEHQHRQHHQQQHHQQQQHQQQHQHQHQHQQHPKKKPKRRVVSFDTRSNETIYIQCHTDYSEKENASYYLQRKDYKGIRQEIQRTINFVKFPSACDENTIQVVPAASGTSSASASTNASTNASTAGCCSTEELCVRGLESLVEDFVNEHKKRVQEFSKSIVLRFQDELKRNKKRRKIEERRNDNDYDVAATLALAEIYKRATIDCEHIARRWGHFDAIDAGIHNPSPSFSTAAIVSASASSATGTTVTDNDDDEESERTEDPNPIAKGTKGEPSSTKASDSLTNVPVLLFHV
mmetsp:Transcript_7417/g.14533  ORF Transcript_7417/g.14533 Transcript_7417/m.14533 type:complete len:364 (-) Transcript_7417:100-1191(-)